MAISRSCSIWRVRRTSVFSSNSIAAMRKTDVSGAGTFSLAGIAETSALQRVFRTPARRPRLPHIGDGGLDAFHGEPNGPAATEEEFDQATWILGAAWGEADRQKRQDGFGIAI